MTSKFFCFLWILIIRFGFSQNGEITNYIYEGNKNTQSESYIEAEKSYRKALSLSPEKAEALYNLGNTHFLDKQYDEASQRFFQTQKLSKNKEVKHQAFHNMGNVYMQKKEYQKAVEAYKNALRNNPADDETRYNYALAKELLEKDKPPEEQEQDDKKDQKDQEEKDKDKEGDQENQDEKDPKKEGDEGDETKDEGKPKNDGDQNKDQKENQKGDKPREKNQTPKQGQLSPQQVQSLLEAMNNQEKKVQDKVNAEKVKGVPINGKKDW
jgi:tetratricopeptide (TPR) repeat protein